MLQRYKETGEEQRKNDDYFVGIVFLVGEIEGD